MSPPRTAGASLQVLLEQHRGRIQRYVRLLVGNRADAEDLTQETFLRAHRELGALRDAAALGGWLHRIASNACTDFLLEAARSRAAEPLDEEAGAGDLVGEASDPGLDLAVDRARMSACGEEFLEQLPPAYRRVLLLHDWHGLTSVEIARQLGCTPGAVKIRLHRARTRFKAALEAGCEFYRDERGAFVGARKKPRKTRG
jgi:RNA polymerase sigma-70 factor (ECF subfamily)